MLTRKAEPSDVEAIARNHQAAWQVGYRGLIADDLLDGLDLDARIEHWRKAVTAGADGHAVLVIADDEASGATSPSGPPPGRGIRAARWSRSTWRPNVGATATGGRCSPGRP
ncbi:MAG TPA: hypothetical protein VFP02_08520 [Acidimicrobiales bacterium]|nr:hypothetical protein [Acidimicrobiales bacterium]